ncbi:hypothetical protein LTR53_008383 [Teratosphaeriaceae sp. CCFEE 6253]|nr:hypothetical protein LTR53_008383 [Teratosphaeriaceae sp. CCFEE 6253]
MGNSKDELRSSAPSTIKRPWVSSIAVRTALFVITLFIVVRFLVGMPETPEDGGTLSAKHGAYTVRNATKDDLDDIVRIVQAGFPDDPEVDYRFPSRKEHPEDYAKWTRIEYQDYLEQPEKFEVHLVEAGSPIALAV